MSVSGAPGLPALDVAGGTVVTAGDLSVGEGRTDSARSAEAIDAYRVASELGSGDGREH